MPPPSNKISRLTLVGIRYYRSPRLELSYTPAAILHRPQLIKCNPFHPMLSVSHKLLNEQLETNDIRLIILAFSKKSTSAESCVRASIRKKCRQAFYDALRDEGYNRQGKLQVRNRRADEWIGGTFTIKPTAEMVEASMDTVRRELADGLSKVLRSGKIMTPMDRQSSLHEVRKMVQRSERSRNKLVQAVERRAARSGKELDDIEDSEEFQAILG